VKMQMTGSIVFKEAKTGEQSVIDDNYEGFGVADQPKEEEEAPKVVNDTFLSELKGIEVADVNDSDDEVYF